MNAETNAKPADPRFAVGTLTYTPFTLAALFFWVLWGDFCMTLMEAVVPSILPLKLKALEAPNWVMGVIMVTIPSLLNVALNPIISTASDRHRGPRGRRIPFLSFATPFVTLTLVLLAFAPDIGNWLHHHVGARTGWSASAIILVTIAVCVVLFNVFNLFINTVFWYLFNDVVPPAFMARFLGIFRIVGSLAGILYNYYVFPHALTHMRPIFLGAAALYFVGFTTMCLKVKEGAYPPPAPRIGNRPGLRAAVKTYLADCLGHRIYRLLFAHYILWTCAGACGTFGIFLQLSLGLTLQQLGTLSAAVGVAVMILTYPAGAIADRIHPIRLMVWVKVALVAIAPLNLIWLFTSFSPQTNYYVLIALTVIDLPLSLIFGAVGIPMMMRLLPKERYGQFCSFNFAICCASASAIAAAIAGALLDTMHRLLPDAVWGKDYFYRTIPCWRIVFLLASLTFLFKLYREWKRLGGAESYVPPGPPCACEPAAACPPNAS